MYDRIVQACINVLLTIYVLIHTVVLLLFFLFLSVEKGIGVKESADLSGLPEMSSD